MYGYIALGLILSQITLWFWQGGGLFDFRMDFLAYCLYGIWACAVIRSQLFLHRYWSLGSGLIGAFLVLNRFVTFTYLVGVSAGFALVCGIVDFLASGRRSRSPGCGDVINLGLSTALLSYWMCRSCSITGERSMAITSSIDAVGEEKYVRAALLGINDLQGHLSFYPNSIIQDHLGRIFFRASAIAIGCALATLLLRAQIPGRAGDSPR